MSIAFMSLAQERVLVWLRANEEQKPGQWATPAQLHCTPATLNALVKRGFAEVDANGRLYRLNVGKQ